MDREEQIKAISFDAEDAVSGEIYLELKPSSKTEDVVQYFIDLCKDMQTDNVDRLLIGLPRYLHLL